MARNKKDQRNPGDDELPHPQISNPFEEYVHNTYEELLEDRVILLNGDLSESLIEKAVVPLMHMAQTKEPIQVWINSFGGSITDSQAVVDILTTVDNAIITMTFGKAMSAGFDVFLSGDYRIVYPNSLLMCHSGSANLGLQTLPQLNIEADLHRDLFRRWAKFYASRTKINEKEWLDILNCGNNKYFFAEEAIQKGLAHLVVAPGKKPTLDKIKGMKW